MSIYICYSLVFFFLNLNCINDWFNTTLRMSWGLCFGWYLPEKTFCFVCLAIMIVFTPNTTFVLHGNSFKLAKLVNYHRDLHIFTAFWSNHFLKALLPFWLKILLKEIVIVIPPTFYMGIPWDFSYCLLPHADSYIITTVWLDHSVEVIALFDFSYILNGWLIDWFLVFNTTFNNISAISWRPVLVMEEAGIPGENHRPWASYW